MFSKGNDNSFGGDFGDEGPFDGNDDWQKYSMDEEGNVQINAYPLLKKRKNNNAFLSIGLHFFAEIADRKEVT